DTEQRLQFLRDMDKARKQLALFRQEMNGLATQMNVISDDLVSKKKKKKKKKKIMYEIEQNLTETQEDNVNLQVLLEKAVKSQKESDVFATQAIRNIHSDLNLVVRENNQLQERLASIEHIQQEHKGNVNDILTRMQEYVYMLEQAQDTIQLMQDHQPKHHHHDDNMSLLGLESRRTSESSSYITEDEEMGISIRKESRHLTVPITSHPRVIHKRASFPSPLLGPTSTTQKDELYHHPSSTEHSHRIHQLRKLHNQSSQQQPGLLLLLND
ncbi:hypothetical protein BC941DRAFT_361319, partial [Chlamydoabsidia padenii]